MIACDSMLSVFPHIDKIVKRKSVFGIAVYLNPDILLLFLFTSIFQFFGQKLIENGTGRILLGPVIFFSGSNRFKRRYHCDRLNFIKPFISVCCNLPPWTDLIGFTKYFGIFTDFVKSEFRIDI